MKYTGTHTGVLSVYNDNAVQVLEKGTLSFYSFYGDYWIESNNQSLLIIFHNNGLVIRIGSNDSTTYKNIHIPEDTLAGVLPLKDIVKMLAEHFYLSIDENLFSQLEELNLIRNYVIEEFVGIKYNSINTRRIVSIKSNVFKIELENNHKNVAELCIHHSKNYVDDIVIYNDTLYFVRLINSMLIKLVGLGLFTKYFLLHYINEEHLEEEQEQIQKIVDYLNNMEQTIVENRL